MLAALKLQTALRSFASPISSSIIPESSHPSTAYVKSRLFPCKEPRSFPGWEADIMGCARKLDMEGAEMRSMMQEGRMREVAVYERKKKTEETDKNEEGEYVLVEIISARGAHICLLKFEREGMEVQVQKGTGWTNSAAATAVADNTDQVFTSRRRLSAPALVPSRSSPRALDTQWRRTRSNGARLPTQRPAYVPVPVFRQTITRNDTVFSTRVNRLDTIHKIIRFGKNGPRVLDLFIALSTIDKGEQTKIEHGRRWFGDTFVGIIQGAFGDQRVWINKDTRVNGSLREQNKRPGRFEIDEREMQVFLTDFIARKAQIMLNLQAWEDATELEARETRHARATRKHIGRQGIRLEREIEHARDAEAEAWRRTYKSLEAVEEARVKLRQAEEGRIEAEQARKRAEENRSKAEARFAKVEAERQRLGNLLKH